MRLAVFTFAFLFLGAAGIIANEQSTDASAVQECFTPEDFESPLTNSTSDVGGITQVIRKRAKADAQLINVLKNMIHEFGPFRKERSGIVYHSKDLLNEWPVVIKVIYRGKKRLTLGKIKIEVRNLWNVKQLYVWGITEDKLYYYLVMPVIGVSHSQVRLPNAGLLMYQAHKRYEGVYHVRHTAATLNQCLFYLKGHVWEAGLVDWQSATTMTGYELKNPPPPFTIPKDSGIFVPPASLFDY